MDFKFNKSNTTATVQINLLWTGRRPAPEQREIIKKEEVVAAFNEQHESKFSVTSVDGPSRVTNFSSAEVAIGTWVFHLEKKIAPRRASKSKATFTSKIKTKTGD